MTELRVHRVGYSFPQGKTVFSDVTFSICKGDLIVILGSNGSGKTTLLRVLAGLLSPTEGKVTIEGVDNALHHHIGIVFQNPDHQMIAATVEEELALGLELRGIPTSIIRERVDDQLQKFSLFELRNFSAELVSGGQKQRIALAAVMSTPVSFLLFDEPDSLLDAPSRKELMNGLEQIRSECGIVWATPDPLRMPEANVYFHLHDHILERSSRDALLELAGGFKF